MPDLPCAGGRLYELLRDGRFVLVESSATASSGTAMVGARWSDRVRTARTEPHAVPGLPTVVLVRPDGYVAWASDKDSSEDVVEAVTRWCGPATFANQYRQTN